MVQFKEPHMADQLHQSSLILQLLVYDVESFVASHFKKDIVITRVWDSVPGESGVHPDKRAVDIRDEHAGENFFLPTEANAVVNYINGKWMRKDGLPSALHHSFQGGPMHIHLQIASLTKTYEK